MDGADSVQVGHTYLHVSGYFGGASSDDFRSVEHTKEG